MTTRETYTLEHPLVQDAKAKFEGSTGRKSAKCALSFDDLFQRFASGEYRWVEIAQEAGVLEGAIRQYYRRYFEGFFGTPNRVQRQRKHRLAYREAQAEIGWRDNENLGPIGESALAAGLSVRASTVVRVHGLYSKKRTNYYTRVDFLEINDKVCRIQTVTHEWSPPPRHRRYAHFQVEQTEVPKYDWHILRAAVPGFPERVLIVPSSALQASSGSKQIYLPLEPRESTRGGQPKIQWRVYENAWHLLAFDY